MKPFRVCLSGVVLLAALAACFPAEETGSPDPPPAPTTGGTVSLSPEREATDEEETVARESTLEPDAAPPEVVLRLEGNPSTRFSGLCEVGGEESVLSGRVPERFTFDLDGMELSCRIQKQDRQTGNLRVILLVGDTTRSVQQTDSPDGTIRISYQDD